MEKREIIEETSKIINDYYIENRICKDTVGYIINIYDENIVK